MKKIAKIFRNNLESTQRLSLRVIESYFKYNDKIHNIIRVQLEFFKKISKAAASNLRDVFDLITRVKIISDNV